MGLKTTNYICKRTNLTLPTAYAIIKKVNVDNGNGYVEMAIQTDREAAFKYEPIDLVQVYVNGLDRSKNLYEQIYEYVKGYQETQVWDNDQRAMVNKKTPRAFTGWENDIVTE